MIINICSDFSDTPGARYKSEGPFSGEEFRETILRPKFLEIRKTSEKITVNLDGCYGYPTSFLEEAFGGLAREFGSKSVGDKFEFISNDEPSLVKEIFEYINQAKTKK